MALPLGPACPSFAYGHLPGNSGSQAMTPHSTTNSSTNTQNNIPPKRTITTNTCSTQGSQGPLVQSRWHQPHRRKLGLNDNFRRRLNRVQSPNGTSSTPRISTTMISVVIFTIFLAFLSLAAHFNNKPVRIAVMMVGGSVSFGLILACFLEHRRGKGKYKPELGYTILLIVMTIPVFTGIYATSWYPQLRSNMLVISTDSVTKVQFPSIAILQRNDWTSQANIRDGGSKCYLGWYNDSAPKCASLDPNTFGNSTMCTCKEFWYNNDVVVEEFVWMNTSYRYKVFDSPSWLIDQTPTYTLLLQTFFDYNATEALEESSTTNPSLMIAVYDSILGMQKAFDLGYTRMYLVNANGIVAVNIGLQIRDEGNGISAYYYSLSLISTPAIDLVCDTSSAETYKWPCHMSLFVQVPNFDRSIITTEKAMTWMNVASAAGGYFSFLQFLSWIISAQAWLPS